MSTRKQLIDQAMELITKYEAADVQADLAEDVHAASVVALQEANDKAAKDNQVAEQKLLADEAQASAAYDKALQDAKVIREDVRRAGEKLVQDAQVDEATKINQKQDARAEVEHVFQQIRETLQAAANAKDVITPDVPVTA